MSVQPLFTPLRMGDLDLPNRIVMAPLIRLSVGRRPSERANAHPSDQ
jgi:2,4-dienoyl-CoA reductase-like NADH-dependent reductase (Old Yellow Enzyme family)